MKLEDLLPSLRAGKKLRRSSWKEGHYIVLSGAFSQEHINISKVEGAASRSWPRSPDCYDFLQDNWEVIPDFVRDGYVPGNFREAFDILWSHIANSGFKLDKTWRTGVDATVRAGLEAVEKGGSKEEREDALAKMCCLALQSLSSSWAEKYVREVMEE